MRKMQLAQQQSRQLGDKAAPPRTTSDATSEEFDSEDQIRECSALTSQTTKQVFMLARRITHVSGLTQRRKYMPMAKSVSHTTLHTLC